MGVKPKQNDWIRPFLFCVLIVFLGNSALEVFATEPQKEVLALYGDRPDLPANIIVDELIRSTLEQELGPRLDFYTEYLDTTRWPEAETQAAIHDFLRRRYAHKKLSVIIAVAQPAINFIRLYGDELFPGVPIVVYGPVDALRDWKPGRPLAGTIAKLDLSGTAELILRLQPSTREILVISGASPKDRWFQSIARSQLEGLDKKVKFTYLTGVAVDDLVRTVRQAPDGTAVLFLSMLQDSAGNKLLSHEVFARIARVARVPVYSQSGLLIGVGSVGGVVFNPESLGRETAQVTLRILRGERVQDLPVQESKSTVPMVDWRQLHRWELDEKRLPAGTVVRFREASPWHIYRWYIVVGISLIMLEGLLISGLLWQSARRRQTSRALYAQEELLRVFVKNVPAAVAMLDRDMRYLQVSDRWCADYLHEKTQVLGQLHYEIFPDIPERWKEIHYRSLQGETLRSDEDRWEGRDGSHWARWEVRPWKTSEGTVGGILILTEDITHRKKMEESLSGMSRKLIESQEQERLRIARELHDDINQQLALLAVELDQLDRSGLPKRVYAMLQEFKGRVTGIATAVQAISHQLHSSKLEYLGLAAAAKSFCREMSGMHHARIDFTQNDVPRNLPREVALCLFRVLQEALQNAVKYSGSAHFEVNLSGTAADVGLRVRDFGRGFTVDDETMAKGLGLVSMRERVSLVKGEIVIKSKPLAGTEIAVHVPVPVADRANEVTSGAA